MSRYDNKGRIYRRIPWSAVNSVPALLNLFSQLADPNEDGILAWDDSAGDFVFIPTPSVNVFQNFSGFVDSAGTAEEVPDGWSASRDSLGVYTITHNLNLSNTNNLRIVVTQINSTNNRFRPTITNRGANSFEVTIDDDVTNSDKDFFFIAQRVGE